MHEAPHIVTASADGVAYGWGGCKSSDLMFQDGYDSCNFGWGNYVRVQHEGGVFTQYAHLAAIFVDAGQKVRKGEPLGIEGNSGGAGAKHIHFSVHRGKALEGGPSVPFTSLATATGVQSSESLRCGFWPTDGKPIAETAYVSTTPKVTPIATYRVRAQLVETPIALGSAPALVCPKDFVVVDGEACLALPRDRKASKILLYFHGRIPEAALFESSWEFGGVARYATERGFAVLAMRGERGLCNWSEEVRHAWCWPTSIEPVEPTQVIVARIGKALKATAVAIHSSSTLMAPYVLGFSNGGFFASLLASDSKLEFSAFAIAQGGDVFGQHFTSERAKPTVLLLAKGDQHQFPRMQKLEAAMKAAGWKPESIVREGEHSLTPEDIKVAIDFLNR